MQEVTKLRVRVWGVLFLARITSSQWCRLQYRVEVLEGSATHICFGQTTFLAHEACGLFYGDFLDALALSQRVQSKKLVPSQEVLKLRALRQRILLADQERYRRDLLPHLRREGKHNRARKGIDGVQVAD